jgi:hypothetical protein
MMTALFTVYSSNLPIDCHILKGRLESDGIICFIFDENLVWVYPFYAVAIGGVKLKVPVNQVNIARKIISSIEAGMLKDDQGEYEISSVFNNEKKRQNELMEAKLHIRQNPGLLDTPDKINLTMLNNDEKDVFIESEKEFHKYSSLEIEYTWSQFWYELFDFERNFFSYLRPIPPEYYIEKELVDHYFSKAASEKSTICPQCKSDNVSFGYATDDSLDLLYLILSGLFTPFPPLRKNHHCFDCGHNFRRRKDEP